MEAYSEFATLYDRLMDDVDYDGWADYYLKLIEASGVKPAKLCDCACGTGAMSIRFAQRGIRVTGVDISGEMLEQAQRRARLMGVQVMYVCQDMCALALPRPMDALVCACDGVNYLLDDERLNAFFKRAHDALRPGGALAFDISSAWKLENLLGDGFFGENRDDAAYLWFNQWDADHRTVTMDLTFFVQREDGLFRRFSEQHVQKAHDAAHIVKLLEGNDFEGIRVLGDKTFDPPKPDEARIHFLALRRN